MNREVKPEADLIRFVAGPDGTVTPDLRRRLPGRGVWVTANREAVGKAVGRGSLVRALGGDVRAAPELADQVDALLLTAAAGALAMARKAGTLVNGFAKVEAALRAGRAVALIHAREAAADGRAKLAKVAAAAGLGDLPVLACFGREQLDLAFGQTHVIHAALLAGQASDNVLERVGALMRYRYSDDDKGGRDPNHLIGSLGDVSAGL